MSLPIPLPLIGFAYAEQAQDQHPTYHKQNE
jgi:hypothetical protein